MQSFVKQYPRCEDVCVREILQEETSGVLGHLRYHLSSPIKISQRIKSFIVNSTRSFTNLYMTFHLLIYVLYCTIRSLFTVLYYLIYMYCTIQTIIYRLHQLIEDFRVLCQLRIDSLLDDEDDLWIRSSPDPLVRGIFHLPSLKGPVYVF